MERHLFGHRLPAYAALFALVVTIAAAGCGPPPSKSGIVGSWRGEGKYKNVKYDYTSDYHYYKSYPALDSSTQGYVVNESGTWRIITGPDKTPASIELTPQTYTIIDPLGKKEDRSDALVRGTPIVGTARPYPLIWSGPDKFKTEAAEQDAYLYRVKG